MAFHIFFNVHKIFKKYNNTGSCENHKKSACNPQEICMKVKNTKIK